MDGVEQLGPMCVTPQTHSPVSALQLPCSVHRSAQRAWCNGGQAEGGCLRPGTLQASLGAAAAAAAHSIAGGPSVSHCTAANRSQPHATKRHGIFSRVFFR